MKLFSAALGVLGLVSLAGAAQADGRIRLIAYDDTAVVRIDGCFGFQTMVEFGPGEHIENVGIGDAAQWLVTPNKRADILFIKPSYRSSHSNMTVTTDRRRYSFELSARPDGACARGQVVYDLRFTYQPDPPPPVVAAADPAPPPEPVVPPPEQRNLRYTFTGARDNVPMRVFDDGRATYFRWSEGASTPAIYALAADKSESPVSFTARGDYLVADQLSPAFILRRGNAVAVLYNDAYQTPALDAASPQPRDATPPKARASRLSQLFTAGNVTHDR